ncbi:MAG: acetyl-CoA carboxylase biotin carboxyl carrier protein [Victivallales bacterium]|nr:acetyl-CoA carboxylase biotin carboxyl carrier protein [Victivallales bacterium]
MELKSISRLAELMARHGLSELEIKENDTSIRLCRPLNDAMVPPMAMAVENEPVSVYEKSSVTAEPVKEEPVDESRYITAPMLGTFFSAATPDAPAFVAEGDEVTPDTVVCIIEAMKVMNEIKAETSGTITKILVPNGSPVEFGQKLFEIR